jgi:nicotinamidase-related amidase
MPEKNIDLHGSAPHKHRFALLLIDVVNDFDFPEADQLLKHARPMARILLRLKRRAQKAGVPVIYVNDNFGQWKSDFRRTVDDCVTQGRGPRCGEIAAAGRKRLLRAQAKAFRIFFYDS